MKSVQQQIEQTTTRHHQRVAAELKAAIEKFPKWANDMYHALAVIGEEYGELQKAVVQYNYEPEKKVTIEDIRSEAIQTICMLHRFLNSLDHDQYRTNWNKSYPQHQLFE